MEHPREGIVLTEEQRRRRQRRSIALALVEGGRRRMGETLHAPLSDRNVELTVTEPRFFDPEGARLNG